MSSTAPLLSGTIEADDDEHLASASGPSSGVSGNIGESQKSKKKANARERETEVLVPGTAARDAEEGGIAGIFKQSSHPAALFCLYLFRSAAIAVYVLCGLLYEACSLPEFKISTWNISSITVVVVLLSLDFWNTRNVAGRTLVGLRYWNEVGDDGESSWVFESRDPSRPANPIDAKMFWVALYAYPLGWIALFIVSLFKFNISFLPIVFLALVFNFSNVVGFTYADRDAQQRWASGASSMLGNFGIGGIGSQLAAGVVRNSVGRFFG